MSDQPLLSPPDEPPNTTAEAPKRPRRDLVPWLCGLGFLVLAAAIFYVWQHPNTPSETAENAATLHTVEQRLTDIDSRLDRVEQRPVPDLGKITERLDALDSRIVDQSKLASQQDTLSGRIESLSGRIESISGRAQSDMDATKQQLQTLAARITTVESNSNTVDAVSKRLNRIAKLEAASLALNSGRPVGDLPGAPESLARYAHAAPPTEAQIRLHFPQAEQAALAARQPGDNDAPFADRVWQRAQGLMTIRRGGDVVLGNPSATILSQAQVALDAGDLADAVKAVETLNGPPAQAMADWLQEAKSLLNARSALSNMTDQT